VKLPLAFNLAPDQVLALESAVRHGVEALSRTTCFVSLKAPAFSPWAALPFRHREHRRWPSVTGRSLHLRAHRDAHGEPSWLRSGSCWTTAQSSRCRRPTWWRGGFTW